MGDYSEGLDWMGERWVVGQTVEEVNELWETRRCAGWWRGETEVRLLRRMVLKLSKS